MLLSMKMLLQEAELWVGVQQQVNSVAASLSAPPVADLAALPCCLLYAYSLCYKKSHLITHHAGSHGTTPSMASDKQHTEDIVIGPMPDAREPPTTTEQTRASQVQAALLCGVINSIITIPVMTSFAAIIFQVRISLLTL
jgi:hypothetical protein